MRTIQFKFISVLIIFLVLCITGVCITLSFLSYQKSDSIVINLARRQRMLTQKITKEALVLAQGMGSKECLEDTIYMFDKTLKGLISGNDELKHPPTQNNEILSNLNHVSILWNVFNGKLNEGYDIKEFVNNVDKAMYRSKNLGENTISSTNGSVIYFV